MALLSGQMGLFQCIRSFIADTFLRLCVCDHKPVFICSFYQAFMSHVAVGLSH